MPAGSSKSTTVRADRIHHFREWARGASTAEITLVGGRGRREEGAPAAAACTGLPPVSVAEIAWSEELGSCPGSGKGFSARHDGDDPTAVGSDRTPNSSIPPAPAAS